jgi:hypothetical protein
MQDKNLAAGMGVIRRADNENHFGALSAASGKFGQQSRFFRT